MRSIPERIWRSPVGPENDFVRERTESPAVGGGAEGSVGVMVTLGEGDGGFENHLIHFVGNGDGNQGISVFMEAADGFEGAARDAAALMEEFEFEGEAFDSLAEDEEADIEHVLETDGRIEGTGGADAGPTDDVTVGEFVDDAESEAAEVGVFAFLHVAVVAGEMDDAGHVGVGKFDTALGGELGDGFRGHDKARGSGTETSRRSTAGRWLQKMVARRP